MYSLRPFELGLRQIAKYVGVRGTPLVSLQLEIDGFVVPHGLTASLLRDGDQVLLRSVTPVSAPPVPPAQQAQRAPGSAVQLGRPLPTGATPGTAMVGKSRKRKVRSEPARPLADGEIGPSSRKTADAVGGQAAPQRKKLKFSKADVAAAAAAAGDAHGGEGDPEVDTVGTVPRADEKVHVSNDSSSSSSDESSSSEDSSSSSSEESSSSEDSSSSSSEESSSESSSKDDEGAGPSLPRQKPKPRQQNAPGSAADLPEPQQPKAAKSKPKAAKSKLNAEASAAQHDIEMTDAAGPQEVPQDGQQNEKPRTSRSARRKQKQRQLKRMGVLPGQPQAAAGKAAGTAAIGTTQATSKGTKSKVAAVNEATSIRADRSTYAKAM